MSVVSCVGAMTADLLVGGSGGRLHVCLVIGNSVIEDSAPTSNGSGTEIGADSVVSVDISCRTVDASGWLSLLCAA